MHHSDLTPAVNVGLAWYYLLAAMMNAAAATFVAYMVMIGEGGSRDGLRAGKRKLPEWLMVTFFGLYGAATLAMIGKPWIGPSASQLAYWLAAIANMVVALAAAADAAHLSDAHAHGHNGNGHPSGPTFDDHIPPVGLGRPMNRTRWTIIWAISALIFQALGITYIQGAHVYLPTIIRDAIDYVSGPTTFFIAATAGFAAMIKWRKQFVNGIFAWSAVNVILLYFGLSMTDFDFRDIVTKPDNVPIVGMMVVVGFFTWFGLRRAVINDARMARGMPNLEELEPDKTLTWPDLVYTELIAMVVQTIVLVVWAIALQAPLEQPASSTSAPNPSKAPWYFLGLQEMLVYFDPWMAGVVLPTLIILGLMAMPYIDTNKRGNGYYTFEQRKFAFITFTYGFLVLWCILILLGTFLRGPNWNFFGPYEYWDLHKLIPLNNVNLSDIFWVDLLGTAKPAAGAVVLPVIGDVSMLVRELPGILIVLGYFLLVPPILGHFFFKKYIAEAGFFRFVVLATLMLFMASLPLKMVLRWTMNLKYLVYMPEIFFNI